MILVTGASGYIGSHFLIEIINKGKDYLAIDNFSRSKPATIDKITKITGKKVNFIKGDIGNDKFISNIFSNYNIEKVAHFAGLKSIEESIKHPLNYYLNNVSNTINLINFMESYSVKNIIFSSSATVYGGDSKSPLNENINIQFPKSPYAQSKYIIEELLRKMSQESYNWNVGILRYFNPIGCHHSGIIGENINQHSSNLIPSLINVVTKLNTNLEIFGNDYETRDGTGVRDYLHIDDLIKGHLRALDYIAENNGYHIWNLGSGKGYSVLEIIKAFEHKLNQKIPISYKPRRSGDVAEYWADISKAKRELLWHTEKNLQSIVDNVVGFIKKNDK